MICGHPSHSSLLIALLIAHQISPVLQLEALVATRQIMSSGHNIRQCSNPKPPKIPTKKIQKMAWIASWIASPRRPSCGSDPFFGRLASLESFES